MSVSSKGTRRQFRTIAVAAFAALLACGLRLSPAQAGQAERDVLPTGKGASEILKETKPPTPEEKAGVFETKPCAPPHAPWTECRHGELYQCRQTLAHFGPERCNYMQRCANTGRRC
jgi:hypothetical protein